MAEHGDAEPKHYVIGRVQEALARDGRVNELEIDVTLAGRRIFIEGEVATEQRRDAITDIVCELLPDYDVVNEVDVVPLSPPEAEQLR
jgi:hypothetical protein